MRSSEVESKRTRISTKNYLRVVIDWYVEAP